MRVSMMELVVDRVGDLARHLPQQFAGHDRGGLRDGGDLDGDVAGALAVAEHDDVLAAHLVVAVPLAGRQHLAAELLEQLATLDRRE